MRRASAHLEEVLNIMSIPGVAALRNIRRLKVRFVLMLTIFFFFSGFALGTNLSTGSVMASIMYLIQRLP